MNRALTTRALPTPSSNHNTIAVLAAVVVGLGAATLAVVFSMEPAAALSLVALSGLGTLMVGGHLSANAALARAHRR